MPYKACIALSRRVPEILLERLREHADIRMPESDAPPDLVSLMREADYALVIPGDRVDRALLDACPRLKMVSTVSAGFDHIDVDACTAWNVRVCNTPGAVVASTADMAFALLLSAARRVVEADAFVRAGRWNKEAAPLFGMDVHHKRMGIIGLGRIGMELAKRARGFDMDVAYHNRRRLSPEEEERLGVRYLNLDTLLEQSDAVMVQVPYGSATHHLIGAPQLARMKPSAVLVNTSRGGVVDDAALAEALRQGRIAAAGLDVTEGEPEVHPELLKLPNVVLTPHSGASTRETHLRMTLEAFDNLLDAIHGEPLRNCVNPAKKEESA
ncbi:2-hydroxyacid dehydrogenase [Zestomonas carbonaria]|uniref:Glyoxylate/hydroxypyruvate reductase B n=1 Tax=Zestomonas carbonaria TaxID=2762745 RepID=A0A7U7I9L9_9GAMM|nr:D-glycerate dehydrogenase [Pseudomonas carbonaria]CAD5108430.1 Glyoxylate/hydroxypyruvate reductase B [Pseudomonas carbonaria]